MYGSSREEAEFPCDRPPGCNFRDGDSQSLVSEAEFKCDPNIPSGRNYNAFVPTVSFSGNCANAPSALPHNEAKSIPTITPNGFHRIRD